MNKLQKVILKQGVSATLQVMAFFARRKALLRASDWLTTLMARVTIRTKNIRKAQTLQELGAQWQRGFPSSKQVPITHIDNNTVYAEIHTPCPLRGTGDTLACYHMMRYDRTIVEQAGGTFVVQSSQAEPGNTFCKVSMRFSGQQLDDLVPAHLKPKS